MPKSKYDTPEARAVRDAALSELAKAQMLAQWERQRQESGQPLGYYGCHRRVRKTRGRVADHSCVTCGVRARHWAHVHDTDPADPQNYQPMCQRCHWSYDQVGAKTTATKGASGRSAAAALAWKRRSPEARREIIRKGWETRRQTMEGQP